VGQRPKRQSTPNCASGFVTSGTEATATCGNLDSGVQYNWKVRTYDGTDFNAAGWEETLTGTPDVIISNTAPELPNFNTDLDQYKMDGATLSDTDQDNVKLEVEFADYVGGTGIFLDTPNCYSDFVADGNIATVTCINLLDTTEYMWRARTNDGVTTSAWQDFGTARDVTIAIGDSSSAKEGKGIY
jgi:hypothetical protein